MTIVMTFFFPGEREFYSQYKFYAAFESFGQQRQPTGQRDFPGKKVTGLRPTNDSERAISREILAK